MVFVNTVIGRIYLNYVLINIGVKMWGIEYCHKSRTQYEAWKPMKILVKTQSESKIYVDKMHKLYGDDFQFRAQSYRVLGDVKAV